MYKLLLPLIVGVLGIQSQPARAQGAYKSGSGKITATVVGVFDKPTSYVEGRVVDIKTQKPISGATVQVKFKEAGSAALKTKTVTTDKAGVFRLGWVGSSKERPLLVQAPSYQAVQSSEVRFEGDVDLKVELAKLAVVRKK